MKVKNFKANSFKFKITCVILSTLMAVCLALSAVFMFGKKQKAFALPSTNEKKITLYTEADGWSREGYTQLAQKLNAVSGVVIGDKDGNGSIDADDLRLATASGSIFSSVTEVKGNTLFGSGVSTLNTDASKEWTLTIGGIDWTPTQLSYSDGGDLVLTLWQADSIDRAQYNPTLNYHRTVSPYSNNYSTSYIRAAVLNNGGTYYDYVGDEYGVAELSANNVVPNETNRYALFTVGDLANYIVAPNQMSWQSDENYVINDLNYEAAGYSDKAASNYTLWGNDKVWLPSTAEVADVFGTTINQRKSSSAYWLRTAYDEDLNIGEAYNESLGYAVRFAQAGGTTVNGAIVYNVNGVRPCINLNISDTVRMVAKTSGYERTNTPDAVFGKMQEAWVAAVNEGKASTHNTSLNTTYTTAGGDPAAQVYWDSESGTVVFKLLADWGAKQSYNGTNYDYASFGGANSGIDVRKKWADRDNTSFYYYYHGGLSVSTGVTLTLDLNGHVLNRNLYDPETLKQYSGTDGNGNSWHASYYGYVIMINGGSLSVIDSSTKHDFLIVDKDGVANCGRITGAKNYGYVSDNDWNGQGGGIMITVDGHLDFHMGSICFNDSYARGAAIEINAGGSMMFYDGILAHGIGPSMGGAVYATGAKGEVSYFGGIIAYNESTSLAGALYLAQDGGVRCMIDGVTIIHNKGVNGGAVYANTGTSNPNTLIVKSGLFAYNVGTNGGVWCGTVGNQAYFFGGTFYKNTASRGGAIDIGSGSTTTICGGEFIENSCTGNGGGIYLGGGTCNMSEDFSGEIKGIDYTGHYGGATFEGNSCEGSGGGIYLQSGTFNMGGGLFEENSADFDGGSIYINSGTFDMTGGTFKNNVCNGNGGGIYLKDGTFSMTGGSFIGNEARYVEKYRYTYTRTTTVNTIDKATNERTEGTPATATITSYTALEDTTTTTETDTTITETVVTYVESADRVEIITGYGGGVYLENGRFEMQNGTFDRNYAHVIGGAVYMADGVLVLDTYNSTHDISSATKNGQKVYTLNSMAFIGADNADATGSQDIKDYKNLGKVNFINNISPSYPGFYCPTVYFAGDLNIKGNETPQHVKTNVYLVNKVDDDDVITERAVVYVAAPLARDGYIGVSKQLNDSGETWIAVGYNYDMTVDDLLCIHCDAGDDYLFSVAKGDDEVSGKEDLSYMYLSRKPQHIHSWQQAGRESTCTVQGYDVWVCTGCQEMFNPENYDHTHNFSPETSEFDNPEEVTDVVTYKKPKGHTFVWNNAGYFVCSVCGERLYFEYEDIESLSYTSKGLQVSISEIDWYLYSLDENNDRVVQAYEYVDSGSSVNAKTVYFGNVMNAGEVFGYVYFDGITQNVNGTYTVPYGSNAGAEVEGDGSTYTYTNTVTSLPTQSNKSGPEIEYTIVKSTPRMEMELPESTRDVWYVSDSENFFSRIEYNVTVTTASGSSVVLDENGMTTPLGTLSWNKTTLEVGEDQIYVWTWTPNNVNNLSTITGEIYVTARDSGLYELNATRTDTSTVIRDDNTMQDIADLYEIVVTFTRDEFGEDTFDQTVASNDPNLRIALISTTTETAYTTVRSGTFYVRFTYYYGTESVSYRTQALTIMPQDMKSIQASIDVEYTIYDNETDLEQALTMDKETGASYITVLGWRDDDTSVPGEPLTAFNVSCANWGSGAGTYAVTVSYGTCTPVTVDVVVTANRIKKIDLVNFSQNATPIVTKVTGDLAGNITNYASFKVVATYEDGSTKEIPKSVDNQLGYTISWQNSTLNLDAYNRFTVSYVEASEYTPNVTSRVSVSEDFKVSGVTVAAKDINYSVKIGETIDYKTIGENKNDAALAAKIIVTVKYSGESEDEAIPYGGDLSNEEKAGLVYYTLSGLEYYEDEATQEFYFTIRVFYGTGSQAIRTRTFTVDASKDEIEGVTASKSRFTPAVITNLITLDYYVEHYVVINENRTKGDLTVYDYNSNVLGGYSRMSASLPAGQNGKFIGGQDNVISIRYTDEEGKSYTLTLTQYITEIQIESIEVQVNDGYGETYVDEYSVTHVGIGAGNVYTSSAVNVASTISGYITVIGVDTIGETQEITAYTVNGSNASGWQAFTVTFTQRSGAKAATVYVNVTAVEMEEISAEFVQGDTVVYAVTRVEDLLSETVVTGHYNDGSTVAINSGYTLSIVDETGATLTAFDASKHNYVKVTYGAFEVVATGEVDVSNKWFTGVEIVSRQTTNTIYVTASAEVIAANLRVREEYSDGSTGAILNYAETADATHYTIEGSFESGAVYVVYSKDGVDVREEVTVLNLTALEIVSIEIDASDVPDDYYLVLGLDNLKNYLIVTATYNDDATHTATIGAEEYSLSADKGWDEAAWSQAEQEAYQRTYTITVTTENGTLETYSQLVKLGRISSIALVERNDVEGPIQASSNVDSYRRYLTVTVNKTDSTQAIVQDGINNNEFHLEGTSTVDGFYEFIVVINGITFETNQTYASYDLSPVLEVVPRSISEFTVTGGPTASDLIISESEMSELAEYYTVTVKYNDGETKTLTYSETIDNDHYTIEGSLNAFEEETMQTITIVYKYRNSNTNTITDEREEERTVKVTPKRVSAIDVSYRTGSQSAIIYTSVAYLDNGEPDLTTLKGKLNSSLTVKDVYNTGLEESTISYSFIGYEADASVKTNGGTMTLYVMTENFREQYEAAKSAHEANPTDEDLENTYLAYEAAKAAATIDVTITAVAPTEVTLSLKSGATFYSSYTHERFANGLIVKEIYNDGSDKTLALSVWDETAGDFTEGYSINVTEGAIEAGGKVSFNVLYYDKSVRREFTSNTVENVVVTKLKLENIVVAVDSSVTIYQSSTEDVIRSALTVTAEFNDEAENREVEAYTIEVYSMTEKLPSSGPATLTITYIFNGTGKSTYASITVTATVPEKITATYNEGEEVRLYTSGELEDVKDAITVRIEGSNSTDFGVTTAYSLSLEEIVTAETAGAVAVTVGEEELYVKAKANNTLSAGRYVVLLTYSPEGSTALTDRVMLEVEAYDLTSREVILSSDVRIYSDYVFAEESEKIKSGLRMSATWNDGINHSREYTFTVTNITEIVGDKEHVYVTYDYTNNYGGTSYTGVNTQITLTLIEAEISDVRIVKAASYELYTSDDSSKVADEAISTLYLVYNSGREEETSWEGYTYTISAPTWSEGGNVAVTFSIEVENETYTKVVTYAVEKVVLDHIEITSYAEDDKIQQSTTRKIYATTNATNVLASITLTAEAVKNDGSRSVIAIDASMLTYAFEDGEEYGEVTLRYVEGSESAEATFRVKLTKIELASIEAELKNEEATIYTNGSVSTLAGYINVTANYTDGTSKMISYGANGYTFTAGDINIGSAVTAQEKTVTISYTEGTKTETQNITVTVSPATLKSITATYNQGTAKLYQSGGIDGILAASTLKVMATFQTGTAGSTETYESEVRDGYEVLYLEDGAEADLPESGRIPITVRYALGDGDPVSTIFYVTITAKAATGIRVEYELKAGEKIYDTTIDEERFVEKLDTVKVYKVYNDGDEEKKIDVTIAEGQTYIHDDLGVAISISSNKWRVTFTYEGFVKTYEPDMYKGKVIAIEASMPADSEYRAYIGATATDIKNQLVVIGEYDDKYVGENGKVELDTQQIRAVFATGNSSSTIGKKDLTVTYTADNSVAPITVSVYVYQKVELANVTFEYQKKANIEVEEGEPEPEYGDWEILGGNTLVGDKYYNLKATFVAKDAMSSRIHLTLKATYGGVDYTKSKGGSYAEGIQPWANPTVGTNNFVVTIDGIYSDDDIKTEGTNPESLFEFYVGSTSSETLTSNITVTKRAVADYRMSYTPNSGAIIYTTSTFEEIMNVHGKLEITAVYNDGDELPVNGLSYVSDAGKFGLNGSDATKQYTINGYTEGSLPAGPVQFVIKYGGDLKDRYTGSYVTITEPKVISYSVSWKEGVDVYYGDTDAQILSGIEVYGAYNDYPAIAREGESTSVPRSGAHELLSNIAGISLTYHGEAFNGEYEPKTYTVSVDISGVANVQLPAGSAVETVNITINKKAITANDIMFYTSYTFTNEKIEAVPTVKVNNKELVNGEDFTLSYPESATANIHAGVNAGEVTVTGAGKYYSGEVTVNFTILQANNEWVTELSIEGWQWGGAEHDPVAEPKFGNVEDIEYHYYTDANCRNEVTRGNRAPSLNAGRYYVKAILLGNTDYRDIESSAKSFQIEAAVMTAYGDKVQNKLLTGYEIEYTYNGDMQIVSASGEGFGRGFGVYNLGNAPISNADWLFSINESWDNVTWSYATNYVQESQAGRYTVQYSVECDNFATLRGSFTLIIKKADVTVTANDVEVEYGSEIEANGYRYELTNDSQGLNKLYPGDTFDMSEVKYGTTYRVGDGISSVNTIEVTEGFASANYNIIYAPGSVTVTAKAVDVTIVNKSSVYGDGALAALEARVEGEYADGDRVVYELTYEAGLTASSGAGTYDININVTASANYAITVHNEAGESAEVTSSGISSVKGTYEIERKAITIEIVTGGESVYGNAIDVTHSSTGGYTNYEVMLKHSTDAWAISEGLIPAKEYTIDVELGDSDNYRATIIVKDKSGADRDNSYEVKAKEVAIEWAELNNQSDATIDYVYSSAEIIPQISYVDVSGGRVTISGGKLSYRETSSKTIKYIGNYEVEVTTSDTNYSLTNTTKSIVVSKATLNIKLNDASVGAGTEVDAVASQITYTAVGKGVNDVVEITPVATGYTTSTAAGEEKTITAAYTIKSSVDTGKSDVADNYNVSIETATLYVTGEAPADILVTGVTLSSSTLEMSVGGSTETLVATVTPSNATEKGVTWSTSNASVATVTGGVVTAAGEGVATITVTTKDGGKTAQCTVTVAGGTAVSLEGVAFASGTESISVGESKTLIPVFTPEHATNKNVTWSSSDSSIASVNENGEVTGVKAGNATITVTTEEGNFTAEVAITVEAAAPSGAVIKITDQTKAYFSSVVDTYNSKGKLTGSVLSEISGGEVGDNVTSEGGEIYISLRKTLKWSELSTAFESSNVSIVNAKGAAVKNTAYVGTGMVITIDGVSFTVVLKGDTDGNGKIAASDYKQALSEILDGGKLTGAYRLAADADSNGKLSASDYKKIMSHTLGVVDLFA